VVTFLTPVFGEPQTGAHSEYLPPKNERRMTFGQFIVIFMVFAALRNEILF
jgi:hypothetical protein